HASIPAMGPHPYLGIRMIQLRGIHRHYVTGGQEIRALDGIDLHIGAGEFVAVTGPSGSGKSSLLNVLGCLDHPSSGCYLIEGRDVASFDDEPGSDLRNRPAASASCFRVSTCCHG